METKTVTFRASGYRRADFEHFIECLCAMGIDAQAVVSKSGATADVTATVPAHVYDARVSRTRHAGRPSNMMRLPHARRLALIPKLISGLFAALCPLIANSGHRISRG